MRMPILNRHKPLFKVKDIFQDCVEDVIQWDGESELRVLIENPFSDQEMRGRYYTCIGPYRYVRVYKDDWLITLKNGFTFVCPPNLIEDLVQEKKNNDRFCLDKEHFDGPYLHYPRRGREAVQHSQEQVSEATSVGDSGREEGESSERPSGE